MKKRLLIMLVTAAMVVSALPMAASAITPTVELKEQALADGVTYSENAGEGVQALNGIENEGTIKCVYGQDGSATLYLNNIEISDTKAEFGQSGVAVIESTVSKLNIVLTGDNSIYTDQKATCIEGNNITVSGDGSLDLYSKDGCGISAAGYLTLDGVNITASTYSPALSATNLDANNPGVININGACVLDLEAEESGAAIQTESGINFNLTDGGIVKASSTLCAVVSINGAITFAADNTITLPENGVVAFDWSLEAYSIKPSLAGDLALEAEIKYTGASLEPITQINATINPVVGQKVLDKKVTFDSTDVENSIKIEEARWLKYPVGTDADSTQVEVTDPDELFQKGYSYIYHAKVTAAEGYKLQDGAVFYVNGDDEGSASGGVLWLEAYLECAPQPEIIDGKDQKIDLNGSAVSATFRSSAEFSTFVEVCVDGNKLDSTNYTASEGSTVVVLTKEYLNTLANGTHTIDIVSTTGTASAEFTIERTTQTNTTVPTGDSSNMMVWLIALMAAVMCASATIFARKKVK